MSDLTKLTLVESVNNVKEKKCSASELVGAYIKRIEKSDKLNCFNTKDLENAHSKAKKIDTNQKLDKALVGAFSKTLVLKQFNLSDFSILLT